MDDALDRVWRALADPTRRDLLDGLRTGPRTTGELAARTPGLSRYAVMKHLGVLEDAGLITVHREGRKRFNHLNAVPLKQVYDRWVSKYEDQWSGSLLSLKRFMERARAKEQQVETLEIKSFAFVVSIDINAKPRAVFDAWFDGCADWFYESEETRAWQKAVMERHVGGRFYMENTGGPKPGKINLLAFITMIEPGRKLRLRGDFTMPSAVTANATVTFEEHNGGCRLLVEHRMVGECAADDARSFETGWLDGMTKLKSLVELC